MRVVPGLAVLVVALACGGGTEVAEPGPAPSEVAEGAGVEGTEVAEVTT